MKTFVKSGLLAAGGMLAALAPLPAGAASFDLLYSFAGGKDGAGPFGALIQDTAGNFYGTTSSGGHKYNGTIFKLAKPAAGGSTWTESVLYAFRGGSKDGSNPDAALAMDSSGALYGTTQDGGVGQVNGTIFRLAPPAAGATAWTETILYKFGHGRGANSVGRLVVGADGSLFGTTCGCGAGEESKGTVFQLSPPAAGSDKWVYRVLFTFTGGADGGTPHTGLTLGANNILYGTTSAGGTAGAGTVFSLAPPARVKGHYKETVLYSFTGADDGAYPRGGVALDAAGNVYTVAQYGGNAAFGNGAGTVIKLAPPAQAGAAWTETTLHTFDGLAGGGQPGSTPVVGADGTVYGTTDLGGNTTVCQNFGEPAGCGTVFALHPPASGTKWGFKVLHAFQISDGEVPWSGLFQDSTGLYGTTELGGSAFNGAVYKLKP